MELFSIKTFSPTQANIYQCFKVCQVENSDRLLLTLCSEQITKVTMYEVTLYQMKHLQVTNVFILNRI